MSIVLKAFPMAFLISPDAKQQSVHGERPDFNIENQNLQLIKVATNIQLEQVNYLMENLDIPYKFKNDTYILNNGLCIHWELYNSRYCAFISLNNHIPLSARHAPAAYLTKQSEILMRTFEIMMKKNIRDLKSKEIFYYCYKTEYKNRFEVLDVLKEHNIENITKVTDTEIRFRYSNKNYKFIRKSKREPFLIETEQRISLVNIIAGQQNITSRTIVTNYTNKDALIKTLSEHGATAIESDELNVSCEMFGMQLIYSKNSSSEAYNLEINRISDEEKCNEMLNDLKDEYALNIQDLTYRTIMSRLQQYNLQLEDERVDEDNSIVLTINVG